MVKLHLKWVIKLLKYTLVGIIVIIFSITQIYAQQYYTNYEDSLTVKLLGLYNLSRLGFSDYAKDNDVTYSPNTAVNAGVGFNYKKIGLYATFKLPNTNFNEGATTSQYFDLKLNSYGRKVGLNFTYSKYLGYSLVDFESESSEQFFDNMKGNSHKDNMSTTTLAFSGIYNLNHTKFSYRAIYSQNERQLKSAGAPIIGLYANFFHTYMTDSTYLLPEIMVPSDAPEKYFNDGLHFNAAMTRNIGLKLGYIYTYVFKTKYFITLGAFAGAGYEDTSFRYKEESPHSVVHLNLYGQTNFALGYNGLKYYIGIIGNTSNFLIGDKWEDYVVKYQQGRVSFVLAKRFSAAPIRKLFNKN